MWVDSAGTICTPDTIQIKKKCMIGLFHKVGEEETFERYLACDVGDIIVIHRSLK